MMTQDLLVKTIICVFLMGCLMQSQTLAFKLDFIFSEKDPLSKSHQNITRDAILQTTVEVCEFQALKIGKDFVKPNILTEESVAEACFSSNSVKSFKSSIEEISDKNAWIDIKHPLSAKHHFDEEMFLPGRELISRGVSAAKASVKKQSYETAREKIGKVLHTLQDFYSHSNWIEMGMREPYSNLIIPDSTIISVDQETPTCRSCNGNNCTGNILEEILTQKKLTSGYFSMFSLEKPKGKCSHGDSWDMTSSTEPTGGINKDTRNSSHGYLHNIAADVATAATKQLLLNIRASVGDSEFLRLMGLTHNMVLCFVIDTTGSMSNEIEAVKFVSSLIIDIKTMLAAEPSEYILVPFNDPDFGPLIRTTDPDLFKKHLNALSAHGGGDTPEMCLSGLQLALTGSPPQTEIFVFTDATAKDYLLKSTILALIQRTKSVVNFMLTNTLARRRRSNNEPVNGQNQFSSRSSISTMQIYHELAQASGGQAIVVSKGNLPQATSIITDTSRSSLVTIFQAVRNVPKPENFTFVVDSSLQNLTIYITGQNPFYTITNPSGVSQSSAESNGSLGIIEKVGNFHTIRPNISAQTAGLWLINTTSTYPYTIKVVGQSKVDFLFDVVEVFQGPHPGYTVLKSRPAANNNVTLLVSMLGGDSVRPTEVALVEVSSSHFVTGTLEKLSSGQYLATINSIPSGEFTVRVVGETNSSRSTSNRFQRQSSTQFQASNVTITTEPDGTMEPGKAFTLPFTVATSGSKGIYQIRVTTDRSFAVDFPSSLSLESGGSGNGTVTLTAPESTPSGTDVTVTIEAEAPEGTDSNYAVLRLAVIAPVTDFTSPVCKIVSVNANCSGNCTFSSWNLSANMSDINGTGIQAVRVLKGNGTLNTSTALDNGDVNITLVDYSASCCFPEVELVAVDSVGNAGTCFMSVKATVNQTTSVPPTTQNNSAQRCWFLPLGMWVNVGVLVLYQYLQY
ncbi:von Willebrand factor A domain-containing protein 7-like [Trichomycterus rosablanca]|uniref:von Willebrand factor A domain-containing protein 7-like n=1 Tax=Trichomycterus rosablanca TaxID=2290929 RepID=UPI002F350C8E